jgi:ATP-dependent Lon protease
MSETTTKPETIQAGTGAAPDAETADLAANMPDPLPVLPIRNMVAFPLTAFPLVIGQERSKRLIDEVSIGNRLLGLVASKDSSLEEPGPEQLHRVGTLAVVQRLAKDREGTVTVLVRTLERIRVEEFVATEPYLKARAVPLPDVLAPPEDVETKALTRRLAELFSRMVGLVSHLPDEVQVAAAGMDDPRQLVYAVSGTLQLDPDEAQQILEIDPVKEKMKHVLGVLNREIELLELGKKIDKQAKAEINKSQRE